MGSRNSNPWAPYDNYKDCSLGICSIYCPQFCYLIFPPPPSEDDSGTPLSPLIIAIIAVLASGFILVSYYTIVTRFCKKRNDPNTTLWNQESRDEISRDQWQVAATGLDETVIKRITVCEYKKGDGLIDGTECAVCLGEFQENESLRLLPKCSHAFHLPCIDMWLKSHSNCPLCRANVIAPLVPILPNTTTTQSNSSADLNTTAYETRPPNDVILVIDNQENNFRQGIFDVDGVFPNDPIQENGNVDNSEMPDDRDKKKRRSASLGTFSCRQGGPCLISDVLRIEDSDEDLKVESDQSWRGIGISKGFEMRRSISTGRFMLAVQDKGKNISILP